MDDPADSDFLGWVVGLLVAFAALGYLYWGLGRVRGAPLAGRPGEPAGSDEPAGSRGAARSSGAAGSNEPAGSRGPTAVTEPAAQPPL